MEIPKATIKDRIRLLFKGLKAYRVDGESMLPTLKSGETVLIDPQATIKVGDIVTAVHPYKKSVKLIKRVESISSDGRYVLSGDNPSESTDSRTLGSIDARDITGKVIRRI